MKSLADRIITFRWLIILGFLAITVGFATQLPKSEIDPDMKSQLPHGMESRVIIDRIEELFGGTEMIMILIKTDDVLKTETLSRVKRIAKEMNRIDGIDKVLSLFDLKSIKGEQGAMIVNPAVKRIPTTPEQRERLREEIRENDMVYGSVVSKDFGITAVIGVLEGGVSDEEMVPRIRHLMEQNPGPEETVLGGLPYTRYEVSSNIRGDLRRLMPAGIVIMLIFLFACFRQFRGVLLPFAVVIMAIIVSMGIIPLLGWKIQIIHIILPVLLIAVANDYGIHLIARYQEDTAADKDRSGKALAKGIFQSLGAPVVLTGVTTMAGMLCLLGHMIVPARQLGILAAVGILYALAASLLFIPAVISFLPVPKSVMTRLDKTNHHVPFLERLLLFFADLVSRKPKGVIAGSLIFSGIAAIGILFVVVDTDPNSYFSEHNPVVRAADLINENLGGSQNISVVYQGDTREPRIMHKIDGTERTLGELPEVGLTTSIGRVVRQMSRALNDPGEPWYDRIPDTRNAVAQYFELYAMSGDAEDFEKLVDFPYEHAIVTARLNTTSTATLKSLVNRIEDMVNHDPDVLFVGGFGVVLSDIAQIIVNGQLLSLAMATVIVAVLLMVLFRSMVAGLISAIPLALSMAILFGLMGYFGIELNVATAMLSSIMIGVGVDYTIHFLWRYREERKSGLNPVAGMRKTLTTTGRGIIFNAISVIIGFVALLISSFLPVRFFGFLVVVSILA